MDADYSIELGREDPVLDLPWTDPDGKLEYFDLKRQPELLARVGEAQQFSELAEFLQFVNSPLSMVESVKCDAWTTEELRPDEEIFGATNKCASYVDLVFSRVGDRQSVTFHERFAKRLIALLQQTPETPSAAELCVRRCFFHSDGTVVEGLYFTAYVDGYGDDESRARQNWEIALRLLANAIRQLSAAGSV